MVTPSPPRYSSARVEVVWRIVPSLDGAGFALLDDTGHVVRSGPSPRELSDWGLANGATRVRWDYDLSLHRAS